MDIELSLAAKLLDAGDEAGAIHHLRAAIEGAPERPDYHYSLGLLLFETGQMDEARQAFEAVIALDPAQADARRNLGIIAQGLGARLEALDHFAEALELAPEDDLLRRNFLECLAGGIFSSGQLPPSLRRHLEEGSRAEYLDEKLWQKAAVNFIMGSEAFKQGLAHVRGDEGLDLSAADWFKTLSQDALLVQILTDELIGHLDMECLLGALRRTLLQLALEGSGGLSAIPIDFICALAHQVFNGEYACPVDEAEKQQLNKLMESLHDDDWAALAVAASYEPLGNWLGGQPAGMPEPLPSLWRRQVDEPAEEAESARTIPALPSSQTETSTRVQALYETNPYPRWQKLANFKPAGLDELLRGTFPHFLAPESLSRPGNILIAGCGTGQQALTAAKRYPTSQVLALDLSRASLAYGMRKARELDIANLQFMQADILDLADLEQRFQLIECSGVLHHMSNPFDGWKILTGLLAEDGIMKIALYSARGRRFISQLRQEIARKNLDATPDGIRQFRARLLALPPDNPLRQVINFSDFYSLSGCRDLLFHVQECCYDLPEVAQCISRLGLRLIGLQVPGEEVRRAYGAFYPEDPAMTDLANWDAFEERNPDTFRGMYQFWCTRSEAERDGQGVGNAP